MTPTRTAAPSDLPLAGEGGERAAGAAETKLTGEVRALYEAGVVPVRELARLAGVSVRTLYYHVHHRGWQRRRASVPRDAAKAARQRARYLAWKAAQPPLPTGLKALDPLGGEAAAAACVEAGAHAQAALAEAKRAAQARSDARCYEILCATMIELIRMRKTRKEGAQPRADRLDALLQDAIAHQMERLVAGAG